ncbi:MAG TPA: response regulator [Vicinamibacterales bacterium]|nr:response regulator [Vicinamibacterales bacterium]
MNSHQTEGVILEDRGPAQLPSSSYVLVVDDEAVVREFLTRCLEGWGYTVRQAGSAAEAIELMMERPASLALLDIRMPGQDGIWLANRLRAHWPRLPIVMATAIDDMQTVRKSRELGVVDYITKPIKREQLQDVVQRAMAAAPAVEDAAADTAQSMRDAESANTDDRKFDADYALELPVRCPACGERVTTLKAVRLVRAHVNFTSTLPRRGRVLACPHCLAIVPGELTNF